jgi:hypothetical protein
VTDWRARTRQVAQQVGIDPDVFERQIWMESKFQPDAYNKSSGATGIAQIIGRWHPGVNPRDPDASLVYAARWIKTMLGNGLSYAKALASYNWGPANVAKWDGKRASLPSETRTYLDYILGDAWPLTGGPTTGYKPPIQPGEAGPTPGEGGWLGALPSVDATAGWLWSLFDGLRQRLRDAIVNNAKDWAARYGGPAVFWGVGMVLISFGLLGMVLAGIGAMARSPSGKLGGNLAGAFGGGYGKAAQVGVTAAGVVL